MMNTKQIRNIALLAHVDAGKTTLSEQFLYISGATRTLGSVDQGTTCSDSMEVEKKRGISVRSALLSFRWNDRIINLIDSPGHADFIAEVERALLAADGVVLLVSAAEGVQAQTGILWEFLREHAIPTLIFVNKCDRAGVIPSAIQEELREELGPSLIFMNRILHAGSEMCTCSLLPDEENPFASGTEGMEKIIEQNETLLEAYLNGEKLSIPILESELKEQCRMGNLNPVFWGSTKTGSGVPELLDGICTYLPPPPLPETEKNSALVYQTRFEKGKGIAAFVKVFSGRIEPKKEYPVNGGPVQKTNTLQQNVNGRFIDVKSIEAGHTGKIYGLQNILPGDSLGKPFQSRFRKNLSHALLTTKISPRKDSDFSQLTEVLSILNAENPDLDFTWYRDENELRLNLNGWIQQETISAEIEERFGIEVDFEPPAVIYKERPSGSYTATESYTMPKPCWAVVTFDIRPLPPGEGVCYRSEVSYDKIARKYQNEIENSIEEILKQGQKGWQVTDAEIVLVDGEDHEIHSRPGDFIIASNIALHTAFAKYGTELLEPILSFQIKAPTEMLGQVASDMHKMRGVFEPPEMDGDRFTMHGLLPLATSLEYPVQLTSRSGGKARIRTQFHSYKPCSDAEGVIRPFRGVNPSDRAKYILKMRGALQ